MRRTISFLLSLWCVQRTGPCQAKLDANSHKKLAVRVPPDCFVVNQNEILNQ
jgi:hypothetical protein